MSSMVITGLEQIKTDPSQLSKNGRIGLLIHPASVDSGYTHASRIFYDSYGKNLTALFSPQHGIFGEQQDNMVESPHSIAPEFGIPIFSLYSETRKPTQRMMDAIDLLVIDLQDVGTRVYTYIYTMANGMMAAAECGKSVVILDRPNPIGGVELEGNLLKSELASFVGLYPIPMRHGMTIGELAQYFNQEMAIGCDLTIVPMRGWSREMYFSDTGLPWVIPSPNFPTIDTAMVYPGQVLLEGTNLSEGRGTTRPFELFGAPYIDVQALGKKLEEFSLPGVTFREHHFLPTFQKWQGETCHGFQMHVTDPRLFRPYRTTLAILQSLLSLYPDDFAWRTPPYEYEKKKLPIDILIGDRNVRHKLEAMEDIHGIEKSWKQDLASFIQTRQKYLLYS